MKIILSYLNNLFQSIIMTSNNLENYITNMNNLIRQNNTNMNLLINTMANNQVIINNYLSLIHREQLLGGIYVPDNGINNSSRNNNVNMRQTRNNVREEVNQSEEPINNETPRNLESFLNQNPFLNRNVRYNLGMNNDNVSYVSYIYDVNNHTPQQQNSQISPIETLLRLFSQSYQVPQTNSDLSNNITNQIQIINSEEISDDVLDDNYHIICFDNYGDIENPLNDICPITKRTFLPKL